MFDGARFHVSHLLVRLTGVRHSLAAWRHGQRALRCGLGKVREVATHRARQAGSMATIGQTPSTTAGSMATIGQTPSTKAALSLTREFAGDDGGACTAAAFQRGAGVAPRPQQVKCLRRVCSALRNDCTIHTPSNYLIQHATGSGKSLTIAALAYALTRERDANGNRFRLVVILSDRKALDEQISDVVYSFFEAHGEAACIERAETCGHLKQLLRADAHHNGACRVVVTTFQKALDRGAAAGDPLGSRRRGGVRDEGTGTDESDEAEEEESHHPDGSPAPADDGSAGQAAGGSSAAGFPCTEPRVALIADEAHRSHGQGTTAALHALLCGQRGQPRHLSYVCFTATPSERSLHLFGVTNHDAQRREPFDCFSLREAIAARLCVDVLARYTTANPVVACADAKGRVCALDDWLGASTSKRAGVGGAERALAARGALLRAKARGALDFVCDALAGAVSHGMDDPKAMLVARSRRHCVEYWKEMRRLLRTATAARPGRGTDEGMPMEATGGVGTDAASRADVMAQLRVFVAFSGTLAIASSGDDGDSSHRGKMEGASRLLSERTLNGDSDVLSLFRARGPALLIVCAKLETGFDEPRVCTMVIDRALRGAHAVQVLGRANRTHPRKPQPRVLDFANSAEEIAAAFRCYYGAATRCLAEHERRAQRGKVLAFITARLLEAIANQSVATVAAEAVATDRVDTLAADVDECVLRPAHICALPPPRPRSFPH